LALWPLYCLFGACKTINVSIDLKAICTFECRPHSTQLFEVQNALGISFAFTDPHLGVLLDSVPREIKFPVTILSRFFSQNLIKENFHLKVKLETQAPVGSGLGGSSTLCVALLKGLGYLVGKFNHEGWHWNLMEWARDVEAEYLKTPTGTQDYLGALFGGLSCFSYELGRVRRETYSDHVMHELDARMLVLFSGEMHQSGLSNWEVYKKAIEGDTQVLSGLNAIRELSNSLHGELQKPHVDWKRVGILLSDEWNTRKKTLGVHTERLDQIVKFLTSKKVDGVKVCGAAQGGSLLVLVEPEKKQELAQACQNQGIQVLPAHISALGVDLELLPA
ncbi:MAG: hypothetical protein ACKOA8_13255, partial [Deltaproteobacteria bacterium]